jgi:hypothetical protein
MAYLFLSHEDVFEEEYVGGIFPGQIGMALMPEKLVELILALESFLKVVDVHTLQLTHEFIVNFS